MKYEHKTRVYLEKARLGVLLGNELELARTLCSQKQLDGTLELALSKGVRSRQNSLAYLTERL